MCSSLTLEHIKYDILMKNMKMFGLAHKVENNSCSFN